jgi:hypothetical protein
MLSGETSHYQAPDKEGRDPLGVLCCYRVLEFTSGIVSARAVRFNSAYCAHTQRVHVSDHRIVQQTLTLSNGNHSIAIKAAY